MNAGSSTQLHPQVVYMGAIYLCHSYEKQEFWALTTCFMLFSPLKLLSNCRFWFDHVNYQNPIIRDQHPVKVFSTTTPWSSRFINLIMWSVQPCKYEPGNIKIQPWLVPFGYGEIYVYCSTPTIDIQYLHFLLPPYMKTTIIKNIIISNKYCAASFSGGYKAPLSHYKAVTYLTNRKVKLLGVMFNQHHRFDSHIDAVIKKD